MGRQQKVQPPFGLSIDPAAVYAAARKCQCMHPAAIDHGKLYIPIEWRGVYRFPVHRENQSPQTDRGL
jgi:hypothetical protein